MLDSGHRVLRPSLRKQTGDCICFAYFIFDFTNNISDFTFFEPCIVIYVCNKNQRNEHFFHSCFNLIFLLTGTSDSHPPECVIPDDVLMQVGPPDDEHLLLETCRGMK
jgi:hypothetical protein